MYSYPDNYFVEPEINCLRNRQWWIFLLAGICAFLAAWMAVAFWRLFAIFRRNQEVVPDDPMQKGQATNRQKWQERTFITEVEDWTVELISGRTIACQILEIVAFMLSVASFLIYFTDASEEYVEICTEFTDSTKQQVDFAINMFFLVYYFLRCMAAPNKFSFILEGKSFADYFTIPQCFVSIYLQRTWTGLRFLRVLYILYIPNILKNLTLLKTCRSIKVATVMSVFTVTVLSAAGIIHLLEYSGDPFDYSNSQKLSYPTCVYFVVVTMTTVGYGDVFCVTALGRMFTMFFLIIGPVIFVYLIMELFFYQNKNGRSLSNVIMVPKTAGHETDDSKSKHSEDENAILDAIAYFIVTNNLPLAIIEQKSFKHLIQTLIPGLNMPSQNMFHSNELIKADLKCVQYISSTCNGWTSSNYNNFVTVTVSFISPEWELESRTLACRKLNANHPTDHVCQFVFGILREFNIPIDKMFSMTTDRGSEYVDPVNKLRIRHTHCFAHVINSFIDEIFSLKDVNDVMVKIDKIKSVLAYTKGAQNYLKTIQRDFDTPENMMPSTSINRRRSKLHQMEYVASNEMAINKFLTTFKKGRFSDYLPSPGSVNKAKCVKLSGSDRTILEHKRIKNLTILLRALEEYTRALGDEAILTASLIISLSNQLTKIIENFSDIDTEFENELQKFITELASVYFNEPHLHIAEYLDPRISINTENLEMILDALKVDYAKMTRKKSGLEKIFLPEVDHEMQGNVDDKYHLLYKEFVLYNSQTMIPLSDNPFKWWKNKKETFPILSQICKKYLCIHATSMSPESLFKRASFFETSNRSSESENYVHQFDLV